MHSGSWPSGSGKEFFVFTLQVRTFVCIFVVSAVFYLLTGLAGCLMNLEINHNARKLT
jgi:hypothetical protein